MRVDEKLGYLKRIEDMKLSADRKFELQMYVALVALLEDWEAQEQEPRFDELRDELGRIKGAGVALPFIEMAILLREHGVKLDRAWLERHFSNHTQPEDTVPKIPKTK